MSTEGSAENEKEEVAVDTPASNGETVTITPPKAASTKSKSDVIADTSHKLENLTKAKAYKLVKSLSDDADFTYFQIGGVLSVIQSNGWFSDDGYDNFKAFVETEFGIGYRKAMYMISIYNDLVSANVPWERVKSLGWTKLKEIASILTEDNVDSLVELAEGMSVLQLQEHIKSLSQGTLETSGDKEEAPATSVSTMTFKVHDDQKEIIRDALEKAKGEANTTVDTVALEGICMSYISGGGSVAPAKSLSEQMKDAGWEEVLSVFEQLWPEHDLTIVPGVSE